VPRARRRPEAEERKEEGEELDGCVSYEKTPYFQRAPLRNANGEMPLLKRWNTQQK